MKKIFILSLLIICVSIINVKAAVFTPSQYLYTFEDPGVNWTQPDFDDNEWFSSDGSSFASINEGNTYNITWRHADQDLDSDVWIRIKLETNEILTAGYDMWTINTFDIHMNGMFILSDVPPLGYMNKYNGIFNEESLNKYINYVGIHFESGDSKYTSMDLRLVGAEGAPNSVPIPNAAFLLFSGVGSLLVFRRKMI